MSLRRIQHQINGQVSSSANSTLRINELWGWFAIVLWMKNLGFSLSEGCCVAVVFIYSTLEKPRTISGVRQIPLGALLNGASPTHEFGPCPAVCVVSHPACS
jgi:hypothetical protein